jgi:hypothetical protein
VKHRRRTRRSLVLVLAAVLAAATGTSPAGAEPPATAEAAAPATAGHPFSDPLWLPLREPARISCTHSNPEGCGGYHGYWAMDFLGDYGDPIHAAGAGVFHIGAQAPNTCHPSGTTDAPGTWAWVDHGGGVVTKYNHLASITATEGQLVTPATRIGTMGREEVEPCAANYLHFEVRTGGITGQRVYPGPLWGCSGTTRVTYPDTWGFDSWNDIPKATEWTHALGDACLPSTTATPSAPAPLWSARGDGTVRVAWSVPSSSRPIDRYVVSREVWGPSVGRWHSMDYRTVPATQTATTFRGLDNGMTYRFRVVAHNQHGNSAWTDHVKGTPAAPPLAPGTDRNLVAGGTYVRFGWYGAVPRGAPVTSYTAGIRHWTGSAWSPWSFVDLPLSAGLTYRWDGLRRNTTYQVTVRAHSSAGSSPWGTYRKLVTLP